jgi:putative endonuclease
MVGSGSVEGDSERYFVTSILRLPFSGSLRVTQHWHCEIPFNETHKPTIFSSMKQWYVYILRCADKSYYTGITNNTERRLAEHETGLDTTCYTYHRRPVELVYYAGFSSPEAAISVEKQIKGWGRKKKEALIDGDFDKLKELAVCMNETNHKNYKPVKDS